MKSSASIWSQKVLNNFQNAASNYANKATLQKEIAFKLAKICSKQKISPGKWVDLGSGSGLLANELETFHPNQKVLRVDGSSGMLDLHKEESETQLWDLNLGVPSWSDPPQLIASSFALHWLDNPPTRLKEWLGALAPEGWLAIAVPIKGSFKEWHDAADAAKVTCSAIPLPSKSVLTQAISHKQIRFNKVMTVRQKSQHALPLLKAMSEVGAQTTNSDWIKVGEWRRIEKKWQRSLTDNQVTLTWLIQLLLIQR